MLPLPTFNIGKKSGGPGSGPAPNGARLCVWRYFFAPAHTKPLAFESVYRSADEQSKVNLTTLSQARQQMADTMKNAVTYPMDPKTIDALDKYGSYLFPLVTTLEAVKVQRLKLHKTPQFTWSGSLCNKDSMPFYTMQSYQFEAVMLLLNMGYLRANAAADLLETCKTDEIPEETCKQASKYLLSAAAVFDYITTCEFCHVPSPPSDRPAEIYSPVAKCLANVCQAEAQQCAIRVATMNGVSPGLIAKLCVNVSEKYEVALTALRELGESDGRDITDALKRYIVLKAQVYRALTYKYIGIQAWEKDENYGMGLGCMTAALSTLGQSMQASPLAGPLLRFGKELRTEHHEIEALYQQYKRDNECVYAAKSVDLLSIKIPESKSTVRMEPFVLPVKDNFTFTLETIKS